MLEVFMTPPSDIELAMQALQRVNYIYSCKYLSEIEERTTLTLLP
jgi:hypothetical protein